MHEPRRETNHCVSLLPGLLFAAFVAWPALLRLVSTAPRKARHYAEPASQTRWAPVGRWLARILPGVLLAGYISWMTMPRAQSIESRAVARTDTPVTPVRSTAWLSRLSTVAGWIVTGIAALLLVVFILWMTLPRILHVQPLIVLSGSMEPTMPIGSVAFVNDAGALNVEVGDIITFQRQEGGRQVLVTHRVIEVLAGEAAPEFRTQGDANSAPDDWVVASESVVGEVKTVIPQLGYVTEKLRSRNGFLLLMAIPGALIIAGEIRKIANEVRVMRNKGASV